jgi:pantetheine-phosphate adenylyltransferase
LIKPIADKYGPSIEDDFDAIIVSPETFETAKEINLRRVEKGKKPLKIIKIPFVLAEDGKPISSTRILKKEIDENGRILKDD